MNGDRPERSEARSRVRTFGDAREEARKHRERRARELQHDERFDKLRGLPARRGLVILGYLLLLAAAGVALWDPADIARVAAPLLAMLGFGVALLLQRTIRHIDDVPDEALDERLVGVRNAAYRTAYAAVAMTTMVVVLLLMAVVGDDVEGRHLHALFWAFGLGAGLTPVAIPAWGQREV